MATTTYLRALIEMRLEEDVDAYVGGLRREGMSWQKCAAAVLNRTGQRVSHETLRQWCGRGDGLAKSA